MPWKKQSPRRTDEPKKHHRTSTILKFFILDTANNDKKKTPTRNSLVRAEVVLAVTEMKKSAFASELEDGFCTITWNTHQGRVTQNWNIVARLRLRNCQIQLDRSIVVKYLINVIQMC